MKESDFQKKLLKSLREHGWWAYKIPDMPRSEGARFIPEKPGDIVSSKKHRSILIECKQIKGIKGFNSSLFKSSRDKKNNLDIWDWNQVKSLNKFEEEAGTSFVAINIINKKEEKRYDFMLVFEWAWLYAFFLAGGKFSKSMIENEIEKRGIRYKGGYDCACFEML